MPLLKKFNRELVLILLKECVDHHVLFLIRHSMQSDLLTLVICGQHVVEAHDCHILADVFRWYRILNAGIADEAVVFYPAKINFVNNVLA